MKTNDLFNAFENLDPDIVYDARAKKQPKINFIKAASAMAAAILLLTVSLLFYQFQLKPVTTLCIDTEESVTLTLNARGIVIGVSPKSAAFEAAKGEDSLSALSRIIGVMLERGSLSNEKNTVLLSLTGGSDDALKAFVETAVKACEESGVSGSTLSVLADDEDIIALSGRKHLSAGKAQVITAIAEASDGLSFDSLKKLSVSQLNIFMFIRKLAFDNIVSTGTPSLASYISADTAKETAVSLLGVSESEVDSLTVSLEVSDDALIYLVKIKRGSEGTAFFIDASTGENLKTVRSNANSLSLAVENAQSEEISAVVPEKSETVSQDVYTSDSPAASTPTSAEDEKITISDVFIYPSDEIYTGTRVTFTPSYTVKNDSQGQKTFEFFIDGVKVSKNSADKSLTYTFSSAGTYRLKVKITITGGASETFEKTLSVKKNADESYVEVNVDGADFYAVATDMRELGFVLFSPPSSSESVAFSTAFEGQSVETRTGEKENGGITAVITNLSQLENFLSEYNYSYEDEEKTACKNTYTSDFFKTKALIVSACTFSDASFYTHLTALSTDSGTLYAEVSLSSGKRPAEESYYCHTLSVYEIPKDSVSDGVLLSLY